MACIRIERAVNGFTVCVQDPKIVERNNAPSKPGGSPSRWEDPDREFVFKTTDQVFAFIEANIDKALPALPEKPSSFDAAYKKALAEEESEDD